MTHWEKWREKIENIGVEFNGKKIEDIYQAATIITVGKDGIPRTCRYDCANCIFRGLIGGIDCVCNAMEWLKSEVAPDKTAPEEKEKMEKDEIKVGDTVKVTENREKKGETGTVRKIVRYTGRIKKLYGVHFDNDSHEWVFSDREIVKVKTKKTSPRIVAYRDGDTVTVKDLETGETASAVCSKDDTFDFHTGAFIAMARLTDFMTDIRLMRLEMEQTESFIDDIKMRFGYLMGEGYRYPKGYINEEEE